MRKGFYLSSIILLLTAPLAWAKLALLEPTIPWGVKANQYPELAFFKPNASLGPNAYDAKKSIILHGIEFTNTLYFNNEQGLSEITYIAYLKNVPYEKACTNIQMDINQAYGQKTNEVHVTDQGKDNYSETIWTSKVDRVVRLFCYKAENNNTVSITIFPRWVVLDCTLRNVEDTSNKAKPKKAFFYYDSINEKIRFFNNQNVTLPFDSTFTSQRIDFSHNNEKDHSTIDLNTGVIMSKFITNGKEELLVGKCKQQ